MTRRLLSLIAIAACCTSAVVSAQQPPKPIDYPKGYKISIKINNCTDSVLFMGYYYANMTLSLDTARPDKKGVFTFQSNDAVLYPGMYFFSNPSGNYTEFMVYHEKPVFSFETDDDNWQMNMRTKNSRQNQLFFGYHQMTRRIYSDIDSAKKNKVSEESFQAYVRSRSRELDSIREAYIAKNPDCMLSLMMNATRPVDVPAVSANGDTLSNMQRYEYYRDHCFDNMPLDNDMIVRTPKGIFYTAIANYLDQTLSRLPADTVIVYVDRLIDRSRKAPEVFKYLVHTIAEKYLQSNVMSYDAIYVHMIKKYYMTGQAFWASPSVIDEQSKRATTWDRILIGRTAPELVLKDTHGKMHSLHALPNRYTLLIFWSPTCGHCKTMIPALYKKYEELREQYDIAAFAILSEPDEPTKPKWLKFIDDHGLDWINLNGGEANIDWHEVYDVVTTPQIFLLDKNKTIIAKHLNADLFERIMKERGAE